MVLRKWSLIETKPAFSSERRIFAILLIGLVTLPLPSGHPSPSHLVSGRDWNAAASTPVNNFTASINRLVDLVALAGSGILSLVWARVAMSWFSNDITKKIQAKDRARDALIGTLLFMAAVTGLLYGLAHWVLTGS